MLIIIATLSYLTIFLLFLNKTYQNKNSYQLTIVFSFVALMLHILIAINNVFSAHILLSITSYSTFFIAFLLSFLLWYQHQHMHNHDINSVISRLPPLQTTEILLFDSILIGFVLLTFSIISGVIFIDDFFGQHLAHKTAFAIFAWLLFLGLLIAKFNFSLRDRRLINAMRIAFICLLLGYFGSKFVLKVLLS